MVVGGGGDAIMVAGYIKYTQTPRPFFVKPLFFVCDSTTQDLKATNDNLKALQLELEKAYQTQNAGVTSSGTLTAILETKDARIATLEKEVGLLEQELDRMRLYAGSPGHALDRSVQFAAAPAFKHQVSKPHLDSACDFGGHLSTPLVFHHVHVMHSYPFLGHISLMWFDGFFLAISPFSECFSVGKVSSIISWSREMHFIRSTAFSTGIG